jgi:TatD DNase family protein
MKDPSSSLPEGYLDAHNHLQELAIPDCGDPGIAAQVVNGTHPDDWEAVQALQGQGKALLFKAYGVHPWRVEGLPSDWEEQLCRYLAAGAASVGEIGLDHWKEPRDERRQIEVFERQLQLASDYSLAPTIHCVRAWGLLTDILRSGPVLPRGFLVHGFGGSIEILHQLAELGGCFSFSAYAAHPGRKRMRDAARACPADRLLVETDAPDMVPPAEVCRYPLTDAAGKLLHHPFEIETAYRFLAEWRGEDAQAMATRVRENFRRLFMDKPGPR